MLTTKTMARCLALLRRMNAGNAVAWDDEIDGIEWSSVFAPMNDDLAKQVMDRVRTFCKWRPSVAEVYEIAVALVRPIPPEAALWSEWCWKCRTQGYADPCWEQFPLLQHKIAVRLDWSAQYRSNWQAGADQFTVAAKAREFHAAYTAAVAEIITDATLGLKMPEVMRDPELYRPVAPFVPRRVAASESDASLIGVSDRDNRRQPPAPLPLPPALEEQMRQIGNGTPEVKQIVPKKSSGVEMTPEKRAELATDM